MKKKKAACQGRPDLNCNNDEYSEPSNDRQQETAPTALAPCAIMFFPGVITLTREDARNLLKNRPEARARFRHLLPFIECVKDFAVTYMTVFQGCHEHAVPPRAPWIVVLGDDTFDALGPDGFHGPSLTAIAAAADEVVIVAGWPESLAYNTAATHAARHRRNVIVIETRTTQHEAWLAALRAVKPDIGTLICLPCSAGGCMTEAPPVYYALNLALNGYPVFPIDKNGKPLTENGIKDATLDPDQIAALWDRHPQAGVGRVPRKEPVSATPFEWRDPASIPRREWIYGSHLIRGFGSATVAPGGVGKSTLVLAEAIAIATGRPILGIQPKKHGRVWYWNGEDPRDEVERRIAAVVLHYGIEPAELDGRLFYDSGRDQEIVIARQTKDGAVVAEPVAHAIEETLIDNKIDVLAIDPFISSHRVTENDNNAIDTVAKRWTAIADEAQCAIELVHHVRKTGGAEATVEDARGAIALIAAVRSARVLNVMTKGEGERTGVDRHRSYFRVENGKNNLAPPPDAAEWYELKSVPLGNGDGLLLPGDHVGVAAPWKWPDPLAGLKGSDFDAAAALIRASRWRESSQATQWVGRPIAQALKLDLNKKVDKARVAAIIKAWLAAGSIRVVEGEDEKRMTRKYVEVSD